MGQIKSFLDKKLPFKNKEEDFLRISIFGRLFFCGIFALFLFIVGTMFFQGQWQEALGLLFILIIFIIIALIITNW